MAVPFAVGLRACCVALGLLVGAARAAEPVSPLVGQTRDQLLARYGEPRSQMGQGNRVIYFYPRERIVLRDNVVVEVEEITGDAPAPSAAPSSPPAGTAKDAPAASARPATPSTPAPNAAEPKLEIKMVLPRSTKDSRPAGAESTKAPAPILPTPSPVTPTIVPPPSSTPVEPAPVPVEEPVKPSAVETTVTSPAPDPAIEKKASDELEAKKKEADELEAKKKKEQALKAARRRMEEASAPEPTGSVISGQTYLLAFVVVAVGAGLLYWRYRQRQLELAASSVENTPVSSATSAPVFTGNGFTAEVLHKLDWKYFEELVAAYYSKTGVVAARTKTGPESPVHIKISWKGEPRPFAYVQCIPHPTGLIDPKPLHALVAALAADDIRRGYVVTDGKFNVPARDFAEEKHLTLLPGDLFLEKLNALPAAARTEIMQSIGAAEVG